MERAIEKHVGAIEEKMQLMFERFHKVLVHEVSGSGHLRRALPSAAQHEALPPACSVPKCCAASPASAPARVFRPLTCTCACGGVL